MSENLGALRRRKGDEGVGLRLRIDPERMRLDDRTVIFTRNDDGGWFCASFGSGAKFMRAAIEDTALQKRIAERATMFLRNGRAADPALARIKAAVALSKDYNPNEPRDERGRWTGNGVAETAAAVIADARSLFGARHIAALEAISARLLAGAASFAPSAVAAGAGAAAFFGTLFFPTPRRVAADGTLPDAADYTYHFDREAGHLTITHHLADGTSETVFSGRYGKDGVFRDEDGNPIGRFLGDSVALDADAVRGYEARRSNANAVPRSRASAPSIADSRNSEPRLCPAPGPDKPGGDNNARAIAYQMFVGMTVNGVPLPQGMAIKMIRPNGEPVYFDDCRLSDGALIEAKGYRYGEAFRDAKIFGRDFLWSQMEKRMMDQSANQLEAAHGRPIEWHFADKRVADYMRKKFAAERPGITVVYNPPPDSLDKLMRGGLI